MLVVISVVFFNQSGYLDSAALSNLADDISSKSVQSQAYGIAVKELAPGSANFSVAYGLPFSLLSSGSNTAYIYFADQNGNAVYDGGWGSCTPECLEETAILRGNYIEDLCIIRSSGGDQCNNAKRADITYLRPALLARISFFNNGGQQFNPSNAIGVRVKLKSPGGLSRSVAIYQSGQVSVQ